MLWPSEAALKLAKAAQRNREGRIYVDGLLSDGAPGDVRRRGRGKTSKYGWETFAVDETRLIASPEGMEPKSLYNRLRGQLVEWSKPRGWKFKMSHAAKGVWVTRVQ